ncbi:MAG: PrsW family intramembrane metalloprotease [Actinobacteria bacterium]|nr:PrsW family intramembrane metalloprotease [Actinomycetota bacterium]
MEPGNLGSAFVFGVVPALVYLGIVYWLDRYEKEPSRLVAIAIAFGAILAPAAAVGIQSLLDVPTSVALQSAVSFSRLNATTPIVEEIVKGLAILAVFYLVRREVDGPLDGLVYGGAVGIGFALATTFMAILTTQSFGSSTSLSLFEAMVAGLNHLFYAGLVGFALGVARDRSNGGIAAAWVVGVAAAIGAHLLHDYLPDWVASSSTGATEEGSVLANLPNFLGLVALAVLFSWSAARESRIVAEELRDEVVNGTVTADDYATVTDPWKRSRTLLGALFDARSWSLRRKLYALEVELAYRKRRSVGAAPGRVKPDVFRKEIMDVRRQLEAEEATA